MLLHEPMLTITESKVWRFNLSVRRPDENDRLTVTNDTRKLIVMTVDSRGQTVKIYVHVEGNINSKL